MEYSSSPYPDVNQAAFDSNNQGLSFFQPKMAASSDNVNKRDQSSHERQDSAMEHKPYTPEQIKQVLSDALSSPLQSQLASRHHHHNSSPLPSSSPYPQTPPRRSLLRHFTAPDSLNDSSSPYSAYSPFDSGLHEPESPNAQRHLLPPSRLTEYDGKDKMPATPRLAPVLSPVRLLASPSAYPENSPQKTFAVEASFLQAMSSVLDRQANIVPDHMLTESEVRAIVRKELEKHDAVVRREVEEREQVQIKVQDEDPLPAAGGFARRITPSHIAMFAAACAGGLVLRRAALRHPGEMAWYAAGAVKGGVLGLLGALGVKGAVWVWETRLNREERGEGTADITTPLMPSARV
jgi:hypothetical protein